VTREHRLSEIFVTLADTLIDDFDAVEMLHYLAEACVELLPIESAGIMLADRTGSLRLTAMSSELDEALELYEIQTDEGPCIDCYRTGVAVTNVVVSESSGRWPRFAVAAEAATVRTTQALPLRLRGDTIGSMNLFSTESGILSAADLALAQALTDMATISILQERAASEKSLLAEQLQNALNSRVLIEQAKGMMAERVGGTPDEAFDRMRRYARNRGARLVDVARSVIDGTLPTEPGTSRG
jgi:GAF domain-containing protein